MRMETPYHERITAQMRIDHCAAFRASQTHLFPKERAKNRRRKPPARRTAYDKAVFPIEQNSEALSKLQF
jgi:hypothetical protein